MILFITYYNFWFSKFESRLKPSFIIRQLTSPFITFDFQSFLQNITIVDDIMYSQYIYQSNFAKVNNSYACELYIVNTCLFRKMLNNKKLVSFFSNRLNNLWLFKHKIFVYVFSILYVSINVYTNTYAYTYIVFIFLYLSVCVHTRFVWILFTLCFKTYF